MFGVLQPGLGHPNSGKTLISRGEFSGGPPRLICLVKENMMDQVLLSLSKTQLQGHLIAHQCLWGGFGGDGARPFMEGYGGKMT